MGSPVKMTPVVDEKRCVGGLNLYIIIILESGILNSLLFLLFWYALSFLSH